MKLQKMFEIVQLNSHKLRKNNPNADGLGFWQPIKKMLSNHDIKASHWKNIKKSYQIVMLQPEYYIDGYGNKGIIEKNHFLIQTIRIPLTEEPSLRKIMQLALNIGQYTGIGSNKREWMNLDNYLTKTDINNLSKQIPDDFYNVFIKYFN